MRIQIAARLRPFSHSAGTRCLIPGTAYQVECFPTLLRISDLSSWPAKPITQLKVNISGPVEDFTVSQDLEKGGIHIWGFTARGYMRYHLYPSADEEKIRLLIEKSPEGGLSFTKEHPRIEVGSWSGIERPLLPKGERLSLGSHLKQEWERLYRAKELKEIFPIWLRWGQLTPPLIVGPHGATSTLLERCRLAIQHREQDKVYSQFLNLFAGGFSGLLVPQWEDGLYQGLVDDPPSCETTSSPLILLHEGAQLIRSLFIQVQEGAIDILPVLPPQFHAGRYLSIACENWGELDIEWSKKTIRRCIFRSARQGAPVFLFHKGVKKYRVRHGHKDKGTKKHCGEPLEVQKGGVYFFDNFER